MGKKVNNNSNKNNRNRKSNNAKKLSLPKLIVSLVVLILIAVGGAIAGSHEKLFPKNNNQSNSEINIANQGNNESDSLEGKYEVKQLADLSENFESEDLTYLDKKTSTYKKTKYTEIYKDYSKDDVLTKNRVTRFVNNNKPKFNDEYFSPDLDFDRVYVSYIDEVYDTKAKKTLKRPGAAFGRINVDTLKKDDRERLTYNPPGYTKNNKKYNSIESGWIYNRCHLIGHQLSGLNDNECNLVTGTRFINIQGMVEYENDIADAFRGKNLQYTSNVYILYYVKPIYIGDELLPRGFHMMAQAFYKPDKSKNKSELTKEDFKKEFYHDDMRFSKFNIYSDNYQPGFVLNYKTGEVKSIVPYKNLKPGEKAYVDKYLKGAEYPTMLNNNKDKNNIIILFIRKEDALNIA